MAAPITRLRASPLARAFALLFGAHFAGLLVPLLTIPWLARQLGPAAWAPVLVAQSLAGWSIMLLEFGFDLAGARSIAQADGTSGVGEAAARVQRARFLLTPIVSLVTFGIAILLPVLPAAFVVATVVYVVARGLSPLWYFQGIGRLRYAAVVDTLGKIVPALLVFVVVREPDDGFLVLVLQAVGGSVATILLTARLHASVQMPRVTNRAAISALREAAPMFGARAASGLYVHANTLLVSVLTSPAAVAAFGGAERIVRAAINLLLPVTQAFFPHVSRLVTTDPTGARAAVTRALVTLVGMGALGAGIAALGAPLLVRVLLGDGYESAVPVLQLLGLIIPLVAAGTVLGVFWALPWRREGLFLGAVLVGGAVNLLLAWYLVPRLHATGMAASVVLAEVAVTVVLASAFIRAAR